MALWLTADRGVTTFGSHVTAWDDQSGLHNSATTASWAGSPLLVKKAVNGHDVVRFSPDNGGQALEIPDATSLQWGEEDFVIAVVASYKNMDTEADVLLFSKQVPMSFPYVGPALYANAWVDSQTGFVVQVQYGNQYLARSSKTGLNDGKMRLYCGRRTGGTNLEVRLNSVVVGAHSTDMAVNVSTKGYPIGIARIDNDTPKQQLDGDIAEIVAIAGEVSPDDLSCLESYLMKRYAL